MEDLLNINPILLAFFATLFTWFMTFAGAIIVCFFKNVNLKILDVSLGFSSGIMIAASFWSLLSPAIELSEELMQDTFYAAIKGIKKFKGECKISVWLCQIAKNKWKDYMVKNKKINLIPLDEKVDNIYFFRR